MLWTSYKTQMYSMLRKKTVVITFFILLTFVMANFAFVAIDNFKTEYIQLMFDYLKKSFLSDHNGMLGYYFFEFYPILVIFATSTCYLDDKNSKMKIYIQSRTGNTNYWIGKALSVFSVTFILFTLPFLIEILLGYVLFPYEGVDPTNFSWLSIVEDESDYVFSQLWYYNRYVYVIINVLVFGLASAVLATFNFSLTTLPIFKFRIFTLFPIYLLVLVVSWIEDVLTLDYTLYYGFFMKMFNIQPTNYLVYFIFFTVLFLISAGLITIKIKKDDIL